MAPFTMYEKIWIEWPSCLANMLALYESQQCIFLLSFLMSTVHCWPAIIACYVSAVFADTGLPAGVQLCLLLLHPCRQHPTDQRALEANQHFTPELLPLPSSERLWNQTWLVCLSSHSPGTPADECHSSQTLNTTNCGFKRGRSWIICNAWCNRGQINSISSQHAQKLAAQMLTILMPTVARLP